MFQGHEEFLAKYIYIMDFKYLKGEGMSRAASQQAQEAEGACCREMAPFLLYPELMEAALCEVVDMEYVFPVVPSKKVGEKIPDKQIFTLLTLQAVSSKRRFMCYHASDAGCQFIVLKSLFEAAVKQSASVECYKILRARLSEAVTEVQVLEISAKEPAVCKNSSYKTVKIRQVEDSGYTLRNNLRKEEDSRISLWQICSLVDDVAPTSYLQEEQANQINELIDVMRQNRKQQNEIFGVPVDIKLWKNYLLYVQVPIDLSLIQDRIKNLYYRSERSLLFDIELVRSNAYKFNEPQSVVCQQAEVLIKVMTSIVQNFNDRQLALQSIFANKKDYSVYK